MPPVGSLGFVTGALREHLRDHVPLDGVGLFVVERETEEAELDAGRSSRAKLRNSVSRS
jgi:hypothetical protein